MREEEGPMLDTIGLVAFLALASVSLSMRVMLSRFGDRMDRDKRDRRNVLSDIVRRSLMMK